MKGIRNKKQLFFIGINYIFKLKSYGVLLPASKRRNIRVQRGRPLCFFDKFMGKFIFPLSVQLMLKGLKWEFGKVDKEDYLNN